MVLSFGLVSALLLGSWAVLKPDPGPGAPGSARGIAADRPGPTSASAVIQTDISGLTDAEVQALRQNLERQAQQPNPYMTAIREVVGPQMSEVDLQALARELNLLCVGSTRAQAQANLIERGIPSVTAKALIENACSIS